MKTLRWPCEERISAGLPNALHDFQLLETLYEFLQSSLLFLIAGHMKLPVPLYSSHQEICFAPASD